MDVPVLLVVLVHAGTGALWLGGMTYSLVVVQPRVARMLSDPVTAEDLYRHLGAGNRWPVVGLITLLGGTGAVLTVLPYSRGGGGVPAAWWLVVGAKAALLVSAAALFWWISWRAWPRRVFALPAELPTQQARFRRAALAMTALVGAGFVLGIVAGHLE